MTQLTCTRRLQFCMGHRVWKHESKCANLHGHNYVILLTARMRTTQASVDQLLNYKYQLDDIGRVVDFSVLKQKFEPWIDKHWDHGFIYYELDRQTHSILNSEPAITHKRWKAPFNPTAEEIAHWVLYTLGPQLLADTDVELCSVKLYETENCYALVELGDKSD